MSIATESFLIAAYVIRYGLCNRGNDINSMIEKPMSEWHAHGFEEMDNSFEENEEIESVSKRFRDQSNAINKIVESESDVSEGQEFPIEGKDLSKEKRVSRFPKMHH